MTENSKPLISVIIPIYNVDTYLKRCLQSIAEQSFKNFEVLMIDDGSPDTSGSICVDYQKKDARFRYYKKVNGGAASARNFGLKLIRGEYIAFIDGDDFLAKDYLKTLYKEIETTGCDIAICSYYVFDVDKNEYFLPLNPSGADKSLNHTYTPEDWVKEFYPRDGMIYTAPWSKLFKRSVIDNVKFPPNIDAGDDQFTIWRAYLGADKISFHNAQNYCYVRNSGSLSHVKISAFVNGVTCLEELMAAFKANGWDTSYMLPLYRQRIVNAYNVSLNNGNLSEARKAKLKLKIIDDH